MESRGVKGRRCREEPPRPPEQRLDSEVRAEDRALPEVAAASAALHLLLRVAETTSHHPTAHARLAAREMTHGRYARWFWVGAFAIALGVLAPFAGWWAALVALVGLLFHEHSYVQAAQAVPLA